MEREPGVPAPRTPREGSHADRDTPKPSPVRIEPPAEAEEMGGEQPCQAHQFWELEDDE
jgi:hypothetical protein